MRVALTGPDGDDGSLGEGLRALGVDTVGVPLLEAGPPQDSSGLDAFHGTALPDYACIAFSSPRAVKAARAQEDPHWFLTKDCLCVGPETARSAADAGYRVRAVGEVGGAAGLLAALDRELNFRIEGKRILLPVSDRARPDLADGLRSRGAILDVVVAYSIRTAPDVEARVDRLLTEGCGAVLLASPSAAEALAGGRAGDRGALPPLFAIGPTTMEEMKRLGLQVAGTAERPTPLGIVDAMKEVGMGLGRDGFPWIRPRRLRRTAAIRDMVRETRLTPDRLVAPMFVTREMQEGKVREPVASMPGVERIRPEIAVDEARALLEIGVRSVLLFGIPREKDPEGSTAWDGEGPVCATVRLLKKEVPELQVWADVCLCEYTDHGHCGVLDGHGAVKNDETLPLLSRAAVACAKAGADAVCPSDMMDGRVGAIRSALDREGLVDTLLVSYAVKYASAFYGPFRDAAGSTPKQGDRRAYQMDSANAREALREAALDEAEGADVLMVKPALAYLDVIHRVREATNLPVAAYNVSGEYAMVKAAAERGWIDGDRVMMETLTSIRRAGADLIVTYHAAEAARLLQ